MLGVGDHLEVEVAPGVRGAGSDGPAGADGLHALVGVEHLDGSLVQAA